MISRVDSEQVVIAALLNDFHRATARTDGISLDKFTKNDHRLIYEALLTLHEDRVPIDLVSVSKASGLAVSDVLAISDTHVSYEHVSHHCAQVVDAWKLNQMEIAMRRSIGEADGSVDPTTLADSLTAELQSIDAETSGFDVTLPEIFDNMMDGILERFDKKIPSGLKTGISFIDEFTNGLKRGNLIIVGARPGVGKTTFALQVAMNMSKYNPVGFFTLEMTEEELMVKMVGATSGIDTFRLEADDLNEHELKKITASRSDIRKFKMIVKDPKTEEPNKIMNQVKAMHSKHGIKACVIDYLQLLESSKKQENRNQEIGKITRRFKRLAMDLNIPIIMLSQLSRPAHSFTKPDVFTPPPRPTLTALRDSGAIEQDANVVIFLHNKEPDEVVKPDIEMIVAKNRGGQLGARYITYDKKLSRFYTEDRFHD